MITATITATIMTKSTKKPVTSAPGVKTLITAASLAATLGGWAVISGTATKPTSIPAPVTEQAAPRTVTIKLAPLPTLVPPITPQPQPQLVTIDQPRSAVPRPAAVAAAPQPAAPTELVLRDVSAPQVTAGGSSSSSSAPAPVVNTKSSR
jgi:hypothetical protein